MHRKLVNGGAALHAVMRCTGGVTPAEVNATAPAHYTGPRTPGGPWQHILLVEMDGVQVYRQVGDVQEWCKNACICPQGSSSVHGATMAQ
jgi:hypothetical protein